MDTLIGFTSIQRAWRIAPLLTSLALVGTVAAKAAQFYLLYSVSQLAAQAAQGAVEFSAAFLTLLPVLVAVPLIDAAADHLIYRLQGRLHAWLQPAALARDLAHPHGQLASQTQSWVGQEGISLVFYVFQQRLSGAVSVLLLCQWNLLLGLAVGAATWYSGAMTSKYQAVMHQDLAGTTDQPAQRAQFYWHTLTGAEFAEESRLFQLGSLLRERFTAATALKLDTAATRTRRLGAQTLKASAPFFLVFFLYIVWTVRQPGTDYAAFLGTIVVAAPGLAGLGTLGSVQLHAIEFESMLRQLAFAQSPAACVADAPAETPGGTAASSPVHNASGTNTPPLVTFTDVSFSYRDSLVLDRLNLDIARGEKVAIVGENGAGKSTLIKLLTGELTPTTGAVQLDNGNPRHKAAGSGGIGLVAQDFMRPPLTATESIYLGREHLHPNHRAITQALGIGSLIAEHDADGEYSRGQWQKLAIARALVTAPAPWGRLLILDEPTSALDIYAEKALYGQVLHQADPTDTLIVITHRLFSITNVDRIIVLANGEVVEQGTHSQLLALGGTYSQMYRTQRRLYSLDAD
ncbi:ATP-binding cassette domain-containing protein [Corynebacterium lizhenjunii]|uniref:ATP-binding cassette domain-containing protein n=1 Tax=Corynebacterium lizhenjunii TaxID=2709394 RepID=A0A7T0KF32_9CORY|nr:ATP-binding cassette domain-containing protein [Corynebacterium lizhenjunii]QPK79364.1 ATP-binding cassette domain-containing protein [Corynebacterium lizhenjunii]